MRNIITRILSAIANAIRGTWKAIYTSGKWTMEWVRDTALPNAWELVCETADAGIRTTREALHAVPNTLSLLTGGNRSQRVVAAPDNSPAAQPLAEQQDDRQRQRESVLATSDWNDLALSTRAAARALLRGDKAQGVPASVVKWLESLDDEERATLASLSVGAVIQILNGDATHGVPAYDHDMQSRIRPEPVSELRTRPYLVSSNPTLEQQERAFEFRRRISEMSAQRM